MKALLDGLKALGPARLAAMAAVALGTLGLLAMLALRGGGEHMALLYADLDLHDSAQAVDQLDKAHIPHQVSPSGTEILVPADQVATARLLLAKQGLPSGGSVGYEIFDRTDALTANQFQLEIDETRALEGELARTIGAIHGVRAARVHLVLPKREPFSRDEQQAQASVMLTMAGSQRLDREGVQAILTLVAAAVPGLQTRNIGIIDSRGTLLARAGEAVDGAGAAMTQEEMRRATELRLSRAVEEMLESSLGAGHVRAEAAVEMNFDQTHETQERYDPDGQVVRSSQSVSDNSSSSENAPGTVTVQNNLPNANASATATGTGSQQKRQEDTTNYEISKTVRTLVHNQPQMGRISLAVMVDGVTAPGADGKPAWRARNPAELAQITALVRSAIGYDEKRGDKVEVVSMRFANEDIAAATPAGMLGLLDREDLLHLAETLLFGVVGVLTLLLVLRPMVMRLTTIPQGALAAPDAMMALPGAGPGEAAAAGRAEAALLADEHMIDLANIEGQIHASSVRRIAELVDKHPEQSLAIVRGWMGQEQS